MIIWKLPQIYKQMLGVNKSELAKRLDLSRWALTKLTLYQPERVDLETLNKLCYAFKVTPGELFEYVPDNEMDKAFDLLTQNGVTKEEAQLIIAEKKGLQETVNKGRELLDKIDELMHIIEESDNFEVKRAIDLSIQTLKEEYQKEMRQ